jgi:hypothetical protein
MQSSVRLEEYQLPNLVSICSFGLTQKKSKSQERKDIQHFSFFGPD